MNIQRYSNRKGTKPGMAVALFLGLALGLGQGAPAFADEKMETEQLVEKARLTLQSFVCDEGMGVFRNLLKNAEGVLIVPQLIKGAFVVGASGGSGVLLVRDRKNNAWSDPAFYTLGGASIGFQIGGESSEVVLLVMTERGVKSLLASAIKLGADVGLAAGPVGIGASAATANLSADILSFARSKGLYGGISLEGAAVASREGMNKAFYGKEASTTDILITHKAKNALAAKLTETTAKAADKETAARKECSVQETRKNRAIA